MVQLY